MTPCEFTIRRAVRADIEPMRNLERRAAQIFLSVGYDFCATGPIRDISEHQRVIDEGATFIGEAGGVIAGFAMVEPMDGEAHLVEIDVDPPFQNRGLARSLIAEGGEWSRLNGFDAMTLTTYRDVPWNAPFYRRIGFAEFEPGAYRKGLFETIEREAAWGFAFAPRIAMRKQLK